MSTFSHWSLADSDRSKLISAVRNGEAFDTVTGRPVSETPAKGEMGFYDFACKYADMKWPRAAATTRRSMADALTAVAPVLLDSRAAKPEDKLIREALWGWGFNTTQRASAPEDIAAALAWVQRNSKPLASLSEPKTIRAALDAVGSKLDGKPAAASYMRRRRAVLWNLLDYAVELGELPVNPITTIKWSAPSYTGKIVDPATVVNPEQASALLATVGSRPGSGPRLMAFYACMYYAGLRPAEAA
ncbi:MAG TPA: hypothetical protein VGD34_28435, partial [Kribbella sp.]